jgi:hypothetical protein
VLAQMAQVFRQNLAEELCLPRGNGLHDQLFVGRQAKEAATAPLGKLGKTNKSCERGKVETHEDRRSQHGCSTGEAQNKTKKKKRTF